MPMPHSRSYDASELAALFAEGVACFNRREFYRCHELLEEVWRPSVGDDREFYQGLIQAAVCLHHWINGNYTGARTLAKAAPARLEKLPPIMHGIALEEFRDTFAVLTAPLLGDIASLRPLSSERCPALRAAP